MGAGGNRDWMPAQMCHFITAGDIYCCAIVRGMKLYERVTTTMITKSSKFVTQATKETWRPQAIVNASIYMF